MSSFLNKKSEYVSAKLTNNGRKSIANGDFKVSYFEIGDSEFNYGHNNKKQKVTSSIENSVDSKYPYLLDNTSEVIYGVPVNNQNKVIVRNLMGPAGMVNGHKEFDSDNCDGSAIKSYYETFFLTALNGTNEFTVNDSENFSVGDHVTILFDTLCGTDPDYPTVNTNTVNSLVYKIISIVEDKLIFDRNLPTLNIVGTGHIINNKYYLNFDVRCDVYDNKNQQDSWLLNVIWDGNIIGFGGSTVDQNYQEFVNDNFSSIKEYFGYNSDNGQLFLDFYGNMVNGLTSKEVSTGFYDCNDIFHEIKPSEQRSVALLHYSNQNPKDFDKDKDLKYDDYISTNEQINDYITVNEDNEPITDNDYFEVYLPFMMYHRNETDELGLKLKMENKDHFIVSKVNNKSKIKYRYLIDDNGYRLGKVFPDYRLIVFDDQDIVASLDYRSNRRFTLPAPTITTLPTVSSNTLFTGNQKQTFFVTYMVSGGDMVSLPCNYYVKVETPDTSTLTPNFNLTFNVKEKELKYLVDSFSKIKQGFVISNIKILIQETDGGLPKPDEWKYIDVTDQLIRNGENLIVKSVLSNFIFTIDRNKYEDADIFDLENFMGVDYLKSPMVTSPQFGETQYFPGSVKVIRSTDIEELNFKINLPSTQFNITQNPTYKTGDKYLTEINLLNDKKEVIVSGKLSTPIKRIGTQVFNVKIDF